VAQDTTATVAIGARRTVGDQVIQPPMETVMAIVALQIMVPATVGISIRDVPQLSFKTQRSTAVHQQGTPAPVRQEVATVMQEERVQLVERFIKRDRTVREQPAPAGVQTTLTV